jgi:hypothetical protein
MWLINSLKQKIVPVNERMVILHYRQILLVIRQVQKPTLAIFCAAEAYRLFKLFFRFGKLKIKNHKVYLHYSNQNITLLHMRYLCW